jgi:hypothetical protein
MGHNSCSGDETPGIERDDPKAADGRIITIEDDDSVTCRHFL